MKIFIAVDSEGPSGIAGYWAHDPRDPFYPEKRALLMGDVNAAVEGCFAAGASEVLVSDDTKFAINTIPELLHPEAKLIYGRGAGRLSRPALPPLDSARDGPPRPRRGGPEPVEGPLLHGMDRSFDGLMLVATHAKEGTPEAVLPHTFTGHSARHRRYWYNGQEVGEIAIYAAAAGYHDVPVIMVTGCEAACREARETLGDEVVTVAVKKGLTAERAILVAPERARAMITQGAKEAIARIGRLKPYKISPPIAVRVQFPNKEFADEYETNHRMKDPNWPARRVDDLTLEGQMGSPIHLIM